LIGSAGIAWSLVVVLGLALLVFVGLMEHTYRRRLAVHRRRAKLVARAHEEERAWTAAELHDDVLQRVALARQELESVTSTTAAGAPPSPDRLRGIGAELVDLAEAIRRIANRVHPTLVDRIGLATALNAAVLDLASATPAQIELDCPPELDGLPADVARAAYRIAQEALRNAVRHANATRIRLILRATASELQVEIADDGRGFDPRAVLPNSLGLAGLHERASAVGGEAIVDSRPGAGSTVRARLPLTA
jgi:signal transduction histidine kinase